MELIFVNQVDTETTYQCMWRSSSGMWSIGTWRVMFGVRAVAWRKDSIGRCVDYCAGDDPTFLIELLATLRTIFLHLPEGISERDVVELLPGWQTRPINRDPCWGALRQLAQPLSEK